MRSEMFMLVSMLSEELFYWEVYKHEFVTRQIIELFSDLLATSVAGPAFLYAKIRVISIVGHLVTNAKSISHPAYIRQLAMILAWERC